MFLGVSKHSLNLPILGTSIWMFPKIVVPQIIHFNKVFHYKPSILGYPYFFGKTHILYPLPA